MYSSKDLPFYDDDSIKISEDWQCMTYLIECIEYSGVLLIRHVVVGLVLVL